MAGPDCDGVPYVDAQVSSRRVYLASVLVCGVHVAAVKQ